MISRAKTKEFPKIRLSENWTFLLAYIDGNRKRYGISFHFEKDCYDLILGRYCWRLRKWVYGPFIKSFRKAMKAGKPYAWRELTPKVAEMVNKENEEIVLRKMS